MVDDIALEPSIFTVAAVAREAHVLIECNCRNQDNNSPFLRVGPILRMLGVIRTVPVKDVILDRQFEGKGRLFMS